MYYKTDAGYGVSGEPLEKTKFEGYKRRYRDPRNKRTADTSPKTLTFSGITEYLKGHIYSMGTGSLTDQFIATTKAI